MLKVVVGFFASSKLLMVVCRSSFHLLFVFSLFAIAIDIVAVVATVVLAKSFVVVIVAVLVLVLVGCCPTLLCFDVDVVVY